MTRIDIESDGSGLREVAARFEAAARRYCSFVETMGSLTPEDRPVEAVRLLSDLIGSAVDLPRNVDVTDAEVERGAAPRIELGDLDFYYEVFDPFIRDELVIGSLSDDLADIYVDLREGIDLLEQGHLGGALWAWRLLYETHWGDHAVDALRALHRMVTGRGQDISAEPQVRVIVP